MTPRTLRILDTSSGSYRQKDALHQAADRQDSPCDNSFSGKNYRMKVYLKVCGSSL